MLSLFLLSTGIQKKYFFRFKFNSSGHSRVCSHFTNEETEKHRLMTVLILLPHTPALFMMSLMQTVGHKVSALTGVLTCLCWLCALTVKRSYLGTSLQDDVDNEKEMLQQQRAEVAALREQLQKQVGVLPF